METKLKEKAKKNSLFGTIKNIDPLYRRITKKFFVKTSDVAAASSAPHGATKALKANMLIVECKRSQTLADARRQNLRGQ